MFEEYYTWEDEIRITFIELLEFMDKNANPLDHLIDLCDHAISSGHWNLKKFDILNARDELKRLRQSKTDISKDCFNSNQSLVDCEQELLYYKNILSKPVAWGLLNDRGDLYDLRKQNNPYNDQNKVVPLYTDREDVNSK